MSYSEYYQRCKLYFITDQYVNGKWRIRYNSELYSIPGVAKLLDSPSHFSKFEIFCELQLNTYLKGMQKSFKNYRNYLLKTYK